MIRRTLAIAGAAVLTAGFTGLAGPAAADSGAGITANGDIQISEVAAELDTTFNGGSIEGGYIELENTTQQALPVGGWKLSGCNTTGEFDIRTFPALTQIPAEGHLLIAHDSYEAPFGPARDFGFQSGAGDLEQSAGGVELVDTSAEPMHNVKWGSPEEELDCANFTPAGVTPSDLESLNYDSSTDTWSLDAPTPENQFS